MTSETTKQEKRAGQHGRKENWIRPNSSKWPTVLSMSPTARTGKSRRRTFTWRFLFAAARYNAHVAKNILLVDQHEEFVNHMVEQYREMLRQHLADASLDPDSTEAS